MISVKIGEKVDENNSLIIDLAIRKGYRTAKYNLYSPQRAMADLDSCNQYTNFHVKCCDYFKHPLIQKVWFYYIRTLIEENLLQLILYKTIKIIMLSMYGSVHVLISQCASVSFISLAAEASSCCTASTVFFQVGGG